MNKCVACKQPVKPGEAVVFVKKPFRKSRYWHHECYNEQMAHRKIGTAMVTDDNPALIPKEIDE